jgi:XTP/dITP diphosphohydrolase
MVHLKTPVKNGMKNLLLATNNIGKLQEIQAILAHLDIHLLTPKQIGLKLEVVEDGTTYAENAALKARAFAHASGYLSLSDDSGLEVDALDGAPGLHSARFSPRPGATDADRRALLLQVLQPYPRPWQAHFHCTVALATPGGWVGYAEGNCPGEIIPQERGSNGFGYDPIFYLAGRDRSMAELSLHEKNELSHRARAVRAAIPLLLEKMTNHQF